MELANQFDSATYHMYGYDPYCTFWNQVYAMYLIQAAEAWEHVYHRLEIVGYWLKRPFNHVVSPEEFDCFEDLTLVNGCRTIVNVRSANW